MKDDKVCEQCEKPLSKYGVRFCSLSCANKKRPDRKHHSTKEIRKCARSECLEEFETTAGNPKRFCSRSCSAKVNNRGVSRYHLNVTECQFCGSTTGSTRRDYCSKECSHEHRLALWLSGELDGNAKYHIKEWVRQYIFELSGWQCEGIDSRTGERCTENRLKPDGKTVLQIDHIDGNWQNSSAGNLRVLCPTCHALTETYGAANMGNGRTWKKDYNQFSPKA